MAQNREGATRRTGQIDRSQAPQRDRTYQRGQQHTAGFRGAQTATAGQVQELEHYLANCLLSKNQAEIELNQFAADQAQNPDVKQFAQQMVKDHQQLAQQLQQIAGGQTSTRRDKESFGTTTPSETERSTSDTTRLPASPGADQSIPPTETTAAAPRLGASSDARETAKVSDRSSAGSGALNQLAEIEQKITERCNQAVREELQQKSGAEFDECYLGTQVAGHMHMLAALEVIPQETQGQLRQFAEQARPKVQQHLEHAKQLMKQVKMGGASSGQTERASTSTRTQ